MSRPKTIVCPYCGKHEKFPAISRWNNSTEICSECGMVEALLGFTKDLTGRDIQAMRSKQAEFISSLRQAKQ